MGAPVATNTLELELDAFRSAVAATDLRALSACDGFTVHDVVAHVAAAANETSITLEAHAAGEAVPPTSEFAAREAPYRSLRADQLVAEMERAFDRMCAAFDNVLTDDPAAAVVSAGVPLPVAGMVTHKRSELSLHRWDIAGDDQLSYDLLSRPELTSHAVLLGHLLLVGGPALFATMGTRFEARLRSPGTPDVVVTVDAAGARLTPAAEQEGPAVHADPAARLLLLWGRRPPDRSRITSDLDFGTRTRLFGLLRGF